MKYAACPTMKHRHPTSTASRWIAVQESSSLLRVYWYALALPPVVVPASPSAVGPPHALTAARASRSQGAYPPMETCTALIAASMLPGILVSEPCLTFQPGAVPFPFALGVPDSRNAFVVSRGFMTSASGIQFRPC